jgi:hypothetical protein
MVVEIGADQAAVVASLFLQQQPLDVSVTADLAGIPRVLHILPTSDACGGKTRKKALGISTRTD